ncbi:MAG: serine hydrolase domain-containing protein, partial [Rectinemataceae bacterium]|nr:serine hydrolase domain-containing protein [Rectinemataceae bacterium]
MKKTVAVICFICVFLSFVAIDLFAENKALEIDDLISGVVDPYMRNMQIPGLAVAVSMPDGKITEKYYGKANIEYGISVDKDTIFEIGSLSKTFTALAIMILRDQKKLDANDGLGKYFPECPAWEKITIKNLLQHTSGIASITSVEPFCSNQMKDWKPEEIVAMLKPLKLDFDTGSKAQYSNSGSILLAMIIEKTSGVSYNAFLQKNIVDPLGMKHTMFVGNSAIVPNRAAGYKTVDGKTRNAEYASLLAPFGSGGIMSNAADLVKLKDAFQPGIIFSKDTIDEMFAAAKLNDGSSFAVSGGIDWTYGYGLETLLSRNGEIAPG